MKKADPIRCRDCRFYHITWDPKAPHGCRALKFKSRWMPSVVVLKSSGTRCLHFREKDCSKRGEAFDNP